MPPPNRIKNLRHRQSVLPALLLCDFAHLADEIARLESAGVEAIHLDVMDGHFVPNLTYGMPLVRAIRQCTDMFLDVHLMMSAPQNFIAEFADAGADLLTVHIEAVAEPLPILRKIKDHGLQAGLALNPPTPIGQVEPWLSDCDLVLVMGVMPGFGGQDFDPTAVDKLQRLRELIAEHTILEVDGGINIATISRCSRAGADWFVAGSAVFRNDDYGKAVRRLAEAAADGKLVP